MKPFIVHRSSLIALLLLAVVGLLTRDLFAAGTNRFDLAASASVIPGTTYYFPDGRASADSAWINSGAWGNVPSYHTVYACLDSTLGYDSPCTLFVETIYGLRGTITGQNLRMDTLQFLAPAGACTDTFIFTQFPEDSCIVYPLTVWGYDEVRFRITVSDSALLDMTDKVNKP